MAKLRCSKVVIIPAPIDDEPSALVPNSLSEKSSFFTEFLLHSYSRIHIPETLLKVRGQEPVFLSNEKSGNLVSKPHNALEAFTATCRSAQFWNKCTRPTAFNFPSFIAFLRSEVRLVFTERDLSMIANSGKEYVIQRFIACPQGKATKVRVCWTNNHPFSTKVIARKSPFPFKSLPHTSKKYKMPPSRRGSFVIQDNEVRLEYNNTQLLKFPRLVSPSKTPSPLRSSQSFAFQDGFSAAAQTASESVKSPYLVSFSSPFDTVLDSPHFLGIDAFVDEVTADFRQLCENAGLCLVAVEFDVMQGEEQRWYFLGMKDYTVESIEDRVTNKLHCLGHESDVVTTNNSPMQRTLSRLKSFFLSNKPLSALKTPYIGKEAITDSRGELFIKMRTMSE